MRHRRDHLPRRRRRARGRARHDAHAAGDEAPRARLHRLRALPPRGRGLRDAREAGRGERPPGLRPRASGCAASAPTSRRACAPSGAAISSIDAGTSRPRDDRHLRLRRRPQGARRLRRGRARHRGALARPLARDHQGPRRRRDGGGRLQARRLRRHARDRPRAHGHRVRRGHRQRPPVLGLSVPRRGRRPQRPAHELLPVAPPARARRAPLPVRVRLGDHRRLPGRAHGAGRLARGLDAAQPRGARRRVHLHLRDRGRARRGQGRARRQAARALRVRRHRRARLRGDRDPQGRRPRDRDLRPLRGRGDGVDDGERHHATTPAGSSSSTARSPRSPRSTASAR